MGHMGSANSMTITNNIYSKVNIPVYVILSFVLVFGCSSTSLVSAAREMPKDTSIAILITVDQSGKGDFKKIQEAIDSVPPNNSEQIFIWVKPGTYREKIVVPADKPFITISGTSASNTIITWADGGGIFDSPTFSVLASDFVARLLTIENAYGSAGKAVALRVSADRAAFYGCRIISYQDTLLDDTGNHYFSNCYIEGATDFICGSGTSLYEKCHIHSVSDVNGSITAQHRESPLQNDGFVFLGCKITGSKRAALGRPWGAYARVIFAHTYMSSVISPAGWDDWRDEAKQRTAYYVEYKCYGPGANKSKRVDWSKSLSDAEIAPFLTKDFIGGQDWIRPTPTKFKRGFTSMP